MVEFPQVLTHREVLHFAKELWKTAPKTGQWDLSLTDVKALDSAFLALLLAILRFAQRNKLHLKLHGLPKNAKALLEVYGIFSLFEKYIV